MINREHYIKPIRPFFDSDLVKIITGVRRSGKSVILKQIIEELSAKTDNLICLNFEDRYTAGAVKCCDDLLEYVRERRKNGKVYVFLDEAQDLDGWQDACKTLRLHDASVFITGSNSRLLSGEFTRELSGRYVSFRVRPFVYKEIVPYAEQLGKKIAVADYLVWGGFPGRFEFPDAESQRRYLTDLDNTIVMNDLIRRYAVRNTALFASLVDYVLRSNSRIFSANSVSKYLRQSGRTCSVNTVMKYLVYLEQAFIIDAVRQYSAKTKRELMFYGKLYDADVALNSLRCTDGQYDLTHNFENIIYNELIYMGYSVKVYTNNSREIDFLCTKDGKRLFLQAAYTVAEEKAYKREFSAFAGLMQNDAKYIVTNDDVDFSTGNVRHIPFKEFLMMENLDRY